MGQSDQIRRHQAGVKASGPLVWRSADSMMINEACFSHHVVSQLGGTTNATTGKLDDLSRDLLTLHCVGAHLESSANVIKSDRHRGDVLLVECCFVPLQPRD